MTSSAGGGGGGDPSHTRRLDPDQDTLYVQTEAVTIYTMIVQ